MGWSEDLARAARPQSPVPTTGHYTVSGLLKSGLLPPSPRANIFTLQALPAGPETCLPADARELASLTWGSRNPGRSSAARPPPPPVPPRPPPPVWLGLLQRLRTQDLLPPGGRRAPPPPPRSQVSGWVDGSARVASPITLRSRGPRTGDLHPSLASRGLKAAVSPSS